MSTTVHEPKKAKGVNLTSQINPWVIDDEVVFLHNDGGEIAVQYWLPDASSVTTEQVLRLQGTYEDILSGWQQPRGRLRFLTQHRPTRRSEVITVRFPETHDPLQRDLIDAEQRANDERVRQGIYKTHNTFILAHVPDTRGVPRSDQRPWNEQERAEFMGRARTERDRIMSHLRNVNIPCEPVMADHALDLMQAWYNQATITDEPLPYDPNLILPDATLQQIRQDDSIRVKTLRTQIIQSELLTDSNEYLTNGDRLLLCMDLKDYGADKFPGMLDNFHASLVNETYWTVVDVVYTGERGNASVVQRNTESSKRLAEDSGRDRDLVNAQKSRMQANEAYFNDGRFLKFGFSVVVQCRSEAHLRQLRNGIRNTWQHLGQHVMTPGHYTNWDQFAYRLAPFSGRNSDFLHIHQPDIISSFLPYHGPWENVGGDTLVVLQNAYGTQQRLTLPKPTELGSHMVILGQTRSGKSFTVQQILMSLYMQGAVLRITDMKDDYRPLAQYLGGEFIPCYPGGKLPNGQPVRFNIFQRKNRRLTMEELREIVAFLKALIHEDLNLALNALLTNAVNGYVGSLSTSGVFEGGTLSGFITYLFNMRRVGNIGFTEDDPQAKAAKAFATALQIFTTGTYGMMFDGESTVDLRNRVVVFDLSGLGKDGNLTAAIMQLIRSNIWNEARGRPDKRNRVVYVSEETGVAGKIPEVRDGLEEISMMGAGFNLMLILIAQNATTVAALDGVLNNISRYIIGRMDTRKEVELLGETLRLNDEQKNSLLRLRRVDGQYNELFVRELKPDTDPQGAVVRYAPTDVAFALFDSSSGAKTRRAELEAQYPGDHHRHLQILVQEIRAARTGAA